MEAIERHKLGFDIFYIGDGIYEVQKIDDTLGWETVMDYSFRIPVLEDDDQAKAIAEGCGYLFKEDSYECINFKE